MSIHTNDVTGPFRSYVLNLLGMLAVCVSLLIAFFYQLVLGEIPCPLCMLQRIGLLLVGLGFLLNVRFGASALHYSMIICSAVIGAGVSFRQMLLHIAPDDGGFGSAFLGYHMYTWGFVAFVVAVVYASGLLALDRNRLDAKPYDGYPQLAFIFVWLLFFLGLANLVSHLSVCGFAVCEGDPRGYLLFH